MIERMDGGTRASTVGAAAPSVGWASGPLGAVQAAAREMSRQAALRVRAVAAFAATRPASTDRQQGERGAMSAERWAARPEVLRPVSEWAAQELSIALDITVQKAEAELVRSLTLVGRLPRVLDAGCCTPTTCGACWSTWRRSPTTRCGLGWRVRCWRGWLRGTG
jgi:hypothetical protein